MQNGIAKHMLDWNMATAKNNVARDCANKPINRIPHFLVGLFLTKNCPNQLGTVKFESGFHFCTVGGVYTGLTAASLCEFAAKLESVPLDAIDFHLGRRDFGVWIRDVFCDEALASEVDGVDVGEENRRERLVSLINSHINAVITA
jgi:hypothetical protein